MKLERYHGQVVKVGLSTVQCAIIGGKWAIDYIIFPSGQKSKYRAALSRQHIKIVKVLPDIIVFEQ